MLKRARFATVFGLLAWSATAFAQQPPANVTLFNNVRVFDGKSDTLSAPQNVLVTGNVITKITKDPIPTDRNATTKIIDGGGKTLMPGLIDGHTHIMFSSISQAAIFTADVGFVNLVAGREASDTLMRGFTTIRDAGGPAFGLRRAIDAGIVPGPRIWMSGAMISQTGGHGDFRLPTELPATPGSWGYADRIGAAAVADDEGTVRKRVREQLALGASFVKLHAGGGVSSSFDPLDVTQFSPAEMRAAVEAAENWGTYVTVHAYTPRAMQQSIAAGVKAIEHGNLVDDATAQLMAEKGIWWCLQPFLDDEDATPFPEGSINRIKQLQMFAGTDTAYKLAKKYKIKTAFGTDSLFDPKVAARQNQQLTKLTRWYTSAEVLKMATGDNGELLALSGLRSPYAGKLGVVEEGALADLLLVDGDPIANIKLIDDPAKNFVIIMKDGKTYKNTMN